MATLRWLFFLAIMLAVVPNGSVDPFFKGLNALTFGLLLCALAFVSLRSPVARHCVHLILAIIVAVSAYIVFQAWMGPVWYFTNPAWQDAIDLGVVDEGAISLAPAESLAAIPSLIVPFVVAALAIALHQDDQAARQLWKRLAYLGGVLAVIALIRHDVFPQAHLFGTRPRSDPSLSGNFFNRNVAAAFFALACFASLGVIAMAASQISVASIKRRFASFDYLSDSRYRQLAVGVFLFVASFTALMLTQSRGGVSFSLLAMLASASVVYMVWPHRAKKGPPRWLVAGLIGLVCGLVFIALGGRTLVRIDDSGFDQARACVAAATVTAIADYPLFGTGFATFQEVFPVYRTAECGIRGIWFEAHNSWLEGYLGLGLAFAVLVAVCIWRIASICVRGIRQRRRMRAIPVFAIAATTYVGLHSLVDFTIQIPGIAIYFSALISSALVISSNR